MATICLVTHFFPPHVGGIEKVAQEQAKGLSKLGHEVHILTSNTNKQDEPHFDGIKVSTYPVLSLAERVRLPYPVPLFKARNIFSEVIKKCDIVNAHGHPYVSSYLACKVAQTHEKPFILTQHNTFIDYVSWLNLAEHLNDWTIGNRVLRNSNHIITVSRKTQEYVLRLGAEASKTSVIYNGVDTSFFHLMDREKSREKLHLPKKRTLILTVRRLSYKNGLDTLLESASLLSKEYPDLLFVVVGTGPERELIERRIVNLQIRNQIVLTGFVPDDLLPTYYNAADYFVIPSSSGEGLPMVLLEAMACGLPVIATTTGGVAEIIKDNINGALIPPRNPRALARAVSRLLAHETGTKPMGWENRKTVEENFTWDQNVHQLNEVYKKFL